MFILIRLIGYYLLVIASSVKNIYSLSTDDYLIICIYKDLIRI